MESTAARIRRYRGQAGISPGVLASRADLPLSTITGIESGERRAKPYELSAIATVLGCRESSLTESDPLRDRVRFAAVASAGAPNPEAVKERLLHLLEMDNYLKRALSSARAN